MKIKRIHAPSLNLVAKPELSSLKHLVLSLAAVLAIGACSSSNEQAHAENNHAKAQLQQRIEHSNQRQRDTTEQQMSAVTSSADSVHSSNQQVKLHTGAYDAATHKSLTMLAAHAPINQNPSYTEQFHHTEENGVVVTRLNPLSTFSIDVDTASYSNVRRMLNQGYLPPADAVRIEEMVNYFDYHYPSTADESHPFAVTTQLAVSPWDSNRVLMRIGIKAPKPSLSQHKAPKNLVFLLDVSGSMNSADKLPLVKRALVMLTQQLTGSDRVAIVVYAGASGVVLEPTAGNNKVKIEQALNELAAGGSTNGGEGIQLAYKLANQSFNKQGINRVILATDGDFNVGMINHNQLIELVERQRKLGIELTTLGFGQGNFNDHLMEQLANKGNGNYAYIDSLNEAHKVLVKELDATLQSVARDVKIQVEFNPHSVAEYRLIGYDNRALKSQDFNNDKVDAGEIGAGHSVTAFYELVLQGGKTQIDALRYQSQVQTQSPNNHELAYIKLRYKPINADTSVLLNRVVSRSQVIEFDQQDSDFKFAVSVISFAQLLKNSQYSHKMDFDSILSLASQNRGLDEYGYRAEFVNLVRMSKALQPLLSNTSQTIQ